MHPLQILNYYAISIYGFQVRSTNHDTTLINGIGDKFFYLLDI